MTLAKRMNETPVTIHPADEIGDGSKDVTTAGTAEQLSTTSTPCRRVIIMGKTANTGDIYVGGSTVSSSRGIVLVPRQSVVIDIDNLNKVYIDAATSTEGVVYTYVV